MKPIVIEVRRNGIVEARHRVHAVAVRDGEIADAAGDPSLVTFFRSSAKPLQALFLARTRPDLDDRLVAIACASHRAEPEQLQAVRDLLAAGGVTEDDLELGFQDGRPPERIYHNCSGKHAGMLAVCRARGWPTEGYRLPEHPLQQAILGEITAAAEATPATGTDHCSVVTFALPLERMAHAFARLPQLPEGRRIVNAMRAHPDLVGGPDGVDYELMRDVPGWFAKGGAEGLLCAANDDGLGVALKAEDGASRPLGPALAALLAPLGVDLPTLARTPIRNSRGERVGEVATFLYELVNSH